MKDEKILIVDDEPVNRSLLQEILQDDYTVSVAENGDQALRLAAEQPDLILLDVMMPDMDGYEVCQQLKAAPATRAIPVIFITAMGQEGHEIRGFEVGAMDYLAKPVKAAIVRARVNTHIELRRARKQLENQNRILEERVQERTQELSDSRLEIVHRLVSATEYKDPETGSHIQRMSYYTAALAKAHGLHEQACDLIRLASPMHDIGKIGIPDNILLKPGKLTPAEWETMQTHTTIGAKILSQSRSKLLRAGQIIALAHHEKWDGSGYPQGLAGKAIPLLGRMTAIADVFDALTTNRPYKTAWPVHEAVAVIQLGRAKHFDPRLVELLVNILPEFLAIKARFPDHA